MAKGGKFPRFRGKGKKANPEAEEAKEGQEAVETSKDTVLGESELPKGPAVNEVSAEGTVVIESNGTLKSPNGTDVNAKGRKGGKQRKRKGGKGKNDKSPAEPEPKKDLAGVIFMCNTSTKKDCYKYRVFGLPEAKKNVVEKVAKGMKLFLFDLDQRVLYGIYKASSAGGMNLESEAFKDSERKFPAQVRFRIHKDCLPLEENDFKQAIKENYFGRNKFNTELNAEQVVKLMQLFRPLDAQGLPKPKPGKDVRKEPAAFKSRNPRGPPPPRGPPRGPPPRGAAARYPREPAYSREYPPVYSRDQISSEIEFRRPEQLRNVVTVPQDLYQPGLTSSHLVSNPDIDLLEAETLYRQRLQLRQMQEARFDPLDRRGYHVDPLMDTSIRQVGIPSEISRKRSLEDILLEERGLASKRPLIQEDIFRGTTEYQRELPVGNYLDSLHAPAASLSYGSLSSQLPWHYP